MSSAFIRDIASLEQLRVAIARFCESCGNLSDIDTMLQTRISSLQNLESKFKREIANAQDDLRSAKSALWSCEADTSEDDEGNTIYPDCGSEQEEVADCQKQLREAGRKYQIYKQQVRNIEKAVAEYQNPKLKFRNLLQFEKEAAVGSLKQLINGAEDYLSISTPNIGLVAGNDSGFGETTGKIDPAKTIIAATVGAAEIMLLPIFSFLGLGGKKYNISNAASNGVITSSVAHENENNVCSKLHIENKNGSNYASILSVSIPPSMHQDGIGKHLIHNMESISRANGCKEIASWANSTNVGFYKNLGYQVRNEIKNAGAEVFKTIDSIFLENQEKAKVAFENIGNADFIKSNDLGRQLVNPLNIIAPVEAGDNKFWSQHGEDLERYLNLIEQYDKCNQLLQNGKTIDEIRKHDSWIANAHDVFTGNEPVKLQKVGGYYRIDGGRHRVAAAQIYFMRTGKVIPIIASIMEKN
jgi:N-acetylglutamate synthase-like GNAT family acetyltransferase